MNVFTLIAFVFEIVASIVVIYGLLHEDRFIYFERRIYRMIRVCAGEVKQTVQAKIDGKRAKNGQ